MLEAPLLGSGCLLALQLALLSELSFGLPVRLGCLVSDLLLGLAGFLLVSLEDFSVLCVELGLQGGERIVLG